jgi:hypothetical protein
MRRIERDPVTFQDRPIFAPKAVVSMMMFLVSDVITDLRVGVRGDAESTISMLPSKITTMGKAVVNPFGGRCLDAIHQLR